MQVFEYTHANLSTPICVAAQQIFSVYYSNAHKSTILLATGGAMIPVLESVERVKSDLSKLTTSKEKQNG